MKKPAGIRPAFAALLLFCLILTACGNNQESQTPLPTPQASTVIIKKPSPAPEAAYPEVRIFYDGLLSDKGFYYADTLFMSPEAICAYAGIEPESLLFEAAFIFRAGGLELKGEMGSGYMEAQGRYFYTPDSYLILNERLYLPQDVIERLFGVSFDFDPENLRADLSHNVVTLMQGGDNYYVENFPAEDHYWLSRIIYAEAKDQPLAGLIGVGNVVYNRVASDKFPHTVIDVIYDRDGTIQFDPAAAGALGEPDEISLIAASLCMEGYNTVGDCMYFVNPDRGSDVWFKQNLDFVMSLGDHDFYRSRENA